MVVGTAQLGTRGDGSGLPRFTGILRPLVDGIAGIKASVHTKLLAGFLTGALLLLGMGVLSLVVIERMSQRVSELNRLETKVDLARQMEYDVTGQSHYRAMALLTKDSTNNDKIANAKQQFAANLDSIEKLSSPGDRPRSAFFAKVRDHNAQFAVSNDKVLALYQQALAAPPDQQPALLQKALDVHLKEEHPISHLLEMDMHELEAASLKQMTDARAAFAADKTTLEITVGIFSIASLGLAMLLGFCISWAIIRPVRTVDTALAQIAGGDFDRKVRVRNQDELGALARNLNATSGQLSTLYTELKLLNDKLQQKVEEQIEQLKRASDLKRYLSPQLAESILSGTLDVNVNSRRKNLTVFFSDIRGFTPMSEHIEPEELTDFLNQYLSAMTEIVFKHGGTLDKYIGDAIMVFFGDPITYDDHAQRAVLMALEMRVKLSELQSSWWVDQGERLTVGMGISTGYVTVGNIGSPARMEYTVVGNHVNLASRLSNRALAGQILVSERTVVHCGKLVEAAEVDEMELEGVSRPIKIYEISEKVQTR
ncbi:MAG TPA: adenylate/guanylate cyclase domain-containing protein [Candidatus Dormibacteraeota bacterium]|jgi:class 3 adenylate cyclase/HAMP domain-containing protein|nr:adenylate/guanylate cyclase domain-containing protein [Candidatus Dormibacteraeota bacterium]